MKARKKWNNAIAGFTIISAMPMLVGCGQGASSATQSPKPVILISLDPTSVVRGSFTTIKWSTTGATDCVASGAWSGPRPTSGSEDFMTHDMGKIPFTLSCKGSGSSAENTAVLTVFRGV